MDKASGILESMKPGAASFLRYLAIALALTVLATLAAVKMRKSPSKPSPECARMSAIVEADLHVGDSETTVIPFFKRQGWKFAAAPIVGLYSVEVHTHTTWLGADYSVLVVVKAENGVIRRVEVSDQCRFL